MEKNTDLRWRQARTTIEMVFATKATVLYQREACEFRRRFLYWGRGAGGVLVRRQQLGVDEGQKETRGGPNGGGGRKERKKEEKTSRRTNVHREDKECGLSP